MTSTTHTHSHREGGTHSPKHRTPAEYSEVLASLPVGGNPFSSFIACPINLRYEMQQQDEKILLFLRQHPVVLMPWVLLGIAMVLAPMIAFPFLFPFLGLPANLAFVIVLAWYLLTAGVLIERFLIWLFNSFIITDERMIDIDFLSLIYKRVNYAQIDKIQDINTRVGGVLYSLLNVGTVFVQTAAEVPEFAIDSIKHPAKVAKLLNELLQEEELEKIEGRVR
jgi:hypothetical protein